MINIISDTCLTAQNIWRENVCFLLWLIVSTRLRLSGVDSAKPLKRNGLYFDPISKFLLRNVFWKECTQMGDINNRCSLQLSKTKYLFRHH